MGPLCLFKSSPGNSNLQPGLRTLQVSSFFLVTELFKNNLPPGISWESEMSGTVRNLSSERGRQLFSDTGFSHPAVLKRKKRRSEVTKEGEKCTEIMGPGSLVLPGRFMVKEEAFFLPLEP